MDAVAEAGKLGISADRAASFINDSRGIATNYASVGSAVLAIRGAERGARIDGSWKKAIDTDYQERRGK